jgi:hypothetical protein
MIDLFTRFWNRRNNYRAVFRSDQGMRVLADLREFCRADTSCVVVSKDGKIDTHATLLAEGRREVWLRITETLNLTDEQLLKLKEMTDA